MAVFAEFELPRQVVDCNRSSQQDILRVSATDMHAQNTDYFCSDKTRKSLKNPAAGSREAGTMKGELWHTRWSREPPRAMCNRLEAKTVLFMKQHTVNQFVVYPTNN